MVCVLGWHPVRVTTSITHTITVRIIPPSDRLTSCLLIKCSGPSPSRGDYFSYLGPIPRRAFALGNEYLFWEVPIVSGAKRSLDLAWVLGIWKLLCDHAVLCHEIFVDDVHKPR